MTENKLDWISLAIVTAGAMVLGLEGLSIFSSQNLNPVNVLLGDFLERQIEAAIYLIIGVAGLYQAYFGYELYQKLKLNNLKESLKR